MSDTPSARPEPIAPGAAEKEPRVNYIYALYLWAFKRLPRKFSVPLLVFLAVYLLLFFPVLSSAYVEPLAESLVDIFRLKGFAWDMGGETYYVFGGIIEALLTIAFVLLGVLLSYWAASIIYSVWRKSPADRVTVHPPVPPKRGPSLRAGERDLLKKYDRIGIILAGGGAKGAYQAGAMKAIYEFIEKYGAHDRVKMVAGTSIGSWNAMFWLTDLVKGPDGGPGLLEQWWQQVDVQSVIRPELYVPLRRNFFLSSQPWQETFEAFFVKNEEARQKLEALIAHADEKPKHGARDGCDRPHFYFTRSNVARAQLEFTTNRNDLSDVGENLPIGQRPRPPVPPDAWEKAQAVYRPGEKNVVDIFGSVFSSMDLPPLFEYWPFGDKYFEDGGVVDNLPIRFGAELEKCDLLFVLPLNANFEQDINMRSVVQRLFRVMDVRQGVLERNSFKMTYLYNELAGLRARAEKYEEVLCAIHEELRGESAAPASLWKYWVEGCVTPERMKNAERRLERHGHDPLADPSGNDEEPEEAAPGEVTEEGREADTRALVRKHKKVQVFSICPAPALVISTAEFWKTKEAGEAFRLMYAYTKHELNKFFRDPNVTEDWIRMAQVSRHGTVTYLEDF